METKKLRPPVEQTATEELITFFKNKHLPIEKWELVVDGVSHSFSNQSVINSILMSRPDDQRVMIETLHELEASGMDINNFLKHLAFESNYLDQIVKN